MKKILLAVFISTSFIISATSFVPMAQAALTNSQIQAVLGLLSAFGADQSVINNVQASLTGGTPTSSAPSFCHNFTRNLTVGSRGADVDALVTALIKQGFLTRPYEKIVNEEFDEDVAAAVVQFQAKYGIRQVGYVGPITRAKLNSLYGCNNPLPTVNVAPIITVTSPTAGKNINLGSQYLIQWTQPNDKAYSAAYYLIPLNSTPIRTGDGTSFMAPSGGYSLGGVTPNYSSSIGSSAGTFISDVYPGTYKIRVYLGGTESDRVNANYGANTPSTALAYDDSDSFTVSGTPIFSTNTTPAPTVTLIYPKDGYAWYLEDQNFEFVWSASNFGSSLIWIYLQTSGGSYIPVAQSVSNTGSYILPKLIPIAGSITQAFSPGSYKAVVCGQFQTATLYSVCSNMASITISSRTTTPAPTITVLSPNGGAYWSPGTVQTVTWSTSNIPLGEYAAILIRLRSVSNGQEYNLITEGNIMSGTFTVPTNIPVGSYYIELKTSVNGISYMDSSDQYIKIVDTTATPAPTITVTSPNGGERIIKGTTYIIKWNSQNVSGVYIKLRKGTDTYRDGYEGAVRETDATYFNGEDSYNWTVPSTLPDGSDYSIRVVSSTGMVLDDSNALFSIIAAAAIPAPTITFITPSQGSANTNVTIYGTNLSGASSVEFYTSNGQISGSLVPSSVSATNVVFTINGVFAANVSPGTYQVGVVTNACAGGCNSNRVGFTLVAPTTAAPTITMTANPTSVAFGNSSLISWKSTGATSCAPSGDPGFALAGGGTSGSASSYGIFGPTTFKVSCTGTGGTTSTSTTVTLTQYVYTAGTAISVQSSQSPKCSCDTSQARNCATTFTSVDQGPVCYEIYNAQTDPLGGPQYMSVPYTRAVIQAMAPSVGGASQTASVLNALFGKKTDTSASVATFGYRWNQNLTIGSTAFADVSALQIVLMKEGVYAGDVTGGFYSQTFQSVKAFQQKYGIEATGFMGLATRTKLNELYKK